MVSQKNVTLTNEISFFKVTKDIFQLYLRCLKCDFKATSKLSYSKRSTYGMNISMHILLTDFSETVLALIRKYPERRYLVRMLIFTVLQIPKFKYHFISRYVVYK